MFKAKFSEFMSLLTFFTEKIGNVVFRLFIVRVP